MGSNSSSGGGGGGGRTDGGQMNSTTATKIGVGNINEKGKLSDQYRSNNDDAFRNRGATKIKKGIKTPSIAINAAAAFLSKPLQAGSKVTRDFFTDKVLGSKNYRGTSKTDFLSKSRSVQESMYKDYINNRTSGKTDAYGNTLSQGNDNNGNQVVQAPAATTMPVEQLPQEVKVAEMTAEEARAKASDLIKKKRKNTGRSKTILTSAQGVTDDKGLTLGKKSLLG